MVLNFVPLTRVPITNHLEQSIKGSSDEVVQLIADIRFASFLTLDMASKNDAIHGIGLA